jgi:capsular exopolysaccharide synthesis family protein
VTAGGESISVNGPIPRGLLGAVIGLLLGVVAALMLDFYDTRLHTREDFQRTLTAPVLAEIPKMNRREADAHTVMIRDAPMSRAAEAFRAVRASLLFQRDEVVSEGRRGFVVMVTSPGPKEGKTTASANLAVAFAEAGYNTLAVNCDFRRPSLRRMFRVEDQPGKAVSTGIPRLSVVTNAVADAGANPAQVVATQRAGVEQMRDRYDVIVLDTAPLLTTNDPIDVVSVADLVVLIVRAGQTRKHALQQAVELMENHRVPVAGVVLVGVTSVPNAYYYYYASDTARAAKTAVKSAPDSTSGSGRRGGRHAKGSVDAAGGNGSGSARPRNPDALPG